MLCFLFFHHTPYLVIRTPVLLLLKLVVFPGFARTADKGLQVEMFCVHVIILNFLLQKLSNSFIVIIPSSEPLLHTYIIIL